MFCEIWRFDRETTLVSWHFPNPEFAALNAEGETTPLVV